MKTNQKTNGKVEILIAEDSPTQAARLAHLLEENGYSVTVAANGREALALLERRKPALVISDIVMPELDGYGLCKAIKADKKLKDIAVMLVTTLSDPQDVIRGLECGADNFLRKPYDERYLLSRIDYLMMNLELRKTQKMHVGMEINLGGQRHFISADRQQILDLLISTYEQAVDVNNELKLREKELEYSNQVLNGLYRIADGLNHAASEQEMAEIALDRALELPGIQAGWISMRNGGATHRLVAARNLPPALECPGAMDGTCACRRRLDSNEIDHVIQILECERLGKAEGDTCGMRYHTSIPLRVGGRTLGLMNLVAPEKILFNEDCLKILDSVGKQAAVALERVRLHENLVLSNTALSIKESEIRAIVDNMLDCIVTIDAQGTVRSANPALERVLGFATADVIGHNVSMLMPEPHRHGHDAYLEHYLSTGEARVIGIGREVEGLHKDGRKIPLELAVSEYTVRGERFFIGTLHDIRERKRFIAEITQARADAEQANRAKSDFLAAMSHEIRTPMNGVIGMVDVLHQTSLKGYQVEIVDTIRDSAYSLLGIIEDILDFSKIEAGRLEIERAPTQVAVVLQQVCDMMNHLAARKGVELVLFTDPTIPEEVLGDALRLRQVLVNLANNAIKFSSGEQRSGKVSLRARLAEHNAERVTVEFQVTDNGIGMDEETQARLFTSFSQADVSTTRRFGGTGLGLAISGHLVKLMGGEIAVQSALDKGSSFTVRLAFPPLPTKFDAGEVASEVAGLSCLVVGGPEGLADDLAVYLTHGGAIVERAPDLAIARERAGAAGLSVWVIDAGDEPPSADELHVAGGARPDLEVRFVVIGRGRRRKPRASASDLIVVDANVLDRQTFLRAVAIAAGRAQPEAEAEAPSGRTEAEVSPPSHEQARLQGRLILVAEDNETNQKVILRQLGLLGFAAHVVGNGRDALESWRSGDYALLLTDLHMPKMDGYEMAVAIRAEEKGSRHTPIVALTANALTGEAERCREAGIDDYLSKPAPLENLKVMVNKWLPIAAQPMAELGTPLAPQAAAPLPVDVSVLKTLVGDDATVIREFLQDFRASSARIAAELRDACQRGQATAAGAAAHKLKSSARSVGALKLGDLCAEMEQVGKTGDNETLAERLPRFEQELAVVEEYLDSLLQ